LKLSCQDKKGSQPQHAGLAAPQSSYAAIDVGSHTIRLMIAQLSGPRELTPVHVGRAITRLAKDFQNSRQLSSASMEESLTVLKSYAVLLSRYNVQATACGATGVMRRAANTADFQQIVRQATGLGLDILSEKAEAMLSAKGILSVLQNKAEMLLLFDLGGSSTEFLLIDPTQTEPVWDTSVFVGASTLTERYLSADPVQGHQVRAAASAAQKEVKPVFDSVAAYLQDRGNSLDQLQLVGTAGTVTTLAAMHLQMEHYDPRRVNGLELSRSWLQEMTNQLQKLPLAERRNIKGLEAGREDIILGGAVIVLEIIDGLHRDRLTVTDAGLLEGLLLNLVEKDRGMFHTPLQTPLRWNWQNG